MRRVAAHDASHLATALVERAVEGEEHGAHLADERRASEAVEDDDGIEEDEQPRPKGKSVAEATDAAKDEQDEGDSHCRSLRLAMSPTVQPMLAKGNHAAEPHDGVGQFGWVAKD